MSYENDAGDRYCADCHVLLAGGPHSPDPHHENCPQRWNKQEAEQDQGGGRIQEIRGHVAAARSEISALCKGRARGGRDWTMCVPVQKDDSDMVLTAPLDDIDDLLEELRTARQENDRLWGLIGLIGEYTTPRFNIEPPTSPDAYPIWRSEDQRKVWGWIHEFASNAALEQPHPAPTSGTKSD